MKRIAIPEISSFYEAFGFLFDLKNYVEAWPLRRNQLKVEQEWKSFEIRKQFVKCDATGESL